MGGNNRHVYAIAYLNSTVESGIQWDALVLSHESLKRIVNEPSKEYSEHPKNKLANKQQNVVI